MRVGIDVTNFFAGLTSGTPVYLHGLVRGLLEASADIELRLLYHHRLNAAAASALASLSVPRVEIVRKGPLRCRVPRGGWWFPRHPDVERLVGEVDVFHAGDFFWPPPGRTPIVASVLDLTTVKFPEYHFWANRWRDRKKLSWASRVPDRIIAISQTTADDLSDSLGIDTATIDVIPLARGHGSLEAAPDDANDREVQRRFGIGMAPYILTVGTIEPRKNHRRLLHAFEGLSESFPDLQLVIVGGRGWKTADFDRALEACAVASRVHTVGSVTAGDLRSLYAGASVFAYPSLYEGFGLPVLEAMAAGTPVLTSKVSAVAEVAGDAAVLVDPTSVEAIASGLERLLRDPVLRQRLTQEGYEREARFTWKRTGALTMESYRRAIEQRIAPVTR